MGSGTTLVIVLLSAVGVHVPSAISAAVTGFSSSLAGYLTPSDG